MKAWRDERSMALLGSGHALPGPALDNDALLARFLPEGHPSLLRARALVRHLGFGTRHVARALVEPHEQPLPGCSNPELAAAAVRAALADTKLNLSDLDFLIGHSATPAFPLPSNIAMVARELAFDGPVAEFRQACTGFANALLMAQGIVSRGGTVVIVGSETGSLFLDPARLEDEGQLLNYVQMGDGAGAVVLGPMRADAASISHVWQGSAPGTPVPGFLMRSGGSNAPVSQGMPEFAHDFASVRRQGLGLFALGFAASGLGAQDFDLVVPHQANGRMAELLSPLLDIDTARFFATGHRLGNTGSAAMWLSLSMLRESNPAAGTRALALGAEATGYFHGGFLYVHG
jgi:3-oxoacyl-[acyl-carrier-protein] synthase III